MLKKALFPTDNCVRIAQLLCEELKLTISRGTIQKELTQHPDYTSLLSISDVLSNYGVATVAFRFDISRFSELPAPFIAVIKDAGDYREQFTVVRSADNDKLTWFNSKKDKWVSSALSDFKSLCPSRIVLLADSEAAVAEPDYSINKWRDKSAAAGRWATFFSIPLLFLAMSATLWWQQGAKALLPVLFTLITLLGALACSLLLWYEAGSENPLLQQICTGRSKVNCRAILSSKGSTIFGISWSSIGFVYFAGGMLFMLFNNILSPSTQTFLAWFNLLVLPYTIYSVYYQWRVVKQWCMLCLMVQAALVAQFLLSFFGGWHSRQAALHDLPVIPLLGAYLLPFLIVNLLLPGAKKNKEARSYLLEFQKMKHRPGVLEALLPQQETVTYSTEGLGIQLGNPNAKHRIVKVCNPYCAPCAKAHKPIEDLLENNPDVQLQIIFLATNHEIDLIRWPAKHLLAIAEKNDPGYTKRALDDWYLPEQRDYEKFAAKYPLNGELALQDGKIDAMAAWCTNMQVNFTPTFYINGYKLPPQYDATDLKYFLSV